MALKGRRRWGAGEGEARDKEGNRVASEEPDL